MRVGKKTAFVLTLGLLAAAVLFFVFRQKDAPDLSNVKDRIRELKRSVEKESANAEITYNPKMKGQIDGLDVSVQEILRQLPAVVQVEVLVSADKPTHRIVHLR